MFINSNRRTAFCGVLFVCALLSLLACTSVKGAPEEPGAEEVVYPWPIGAVNSLEIDELATISLAEGTLTPTGAEFLVTNNYDTEVTFGDAFWLLIEVGDRWCDINWSHDVDPEKDGVIVQNMDGNPVAAHGSQVFSENWEKMYGKLPPGKYLFVKNYHIKLEPPRQGETKRYHYICCPFTIK